MCCSSRWMTFAAIALGCYGNAAVKTPNIDRLTARGVVFERAYVPYPVCNPSRCSFLTGLQPDQTGVTDNNTLLRDKLPEVMTFPQLLKEHGWHSAAFGKIFHLGGGRNAPATKHEEWWTCRLRGTRPRASTRRRFARAGEAGGTRPVRGQAQLVSLGPHGRRPTTTSNRKAVSQRRDRADRQLQAMGRG